MDNPLFWLISLVAALVIYRFLSRRMVTPKTRVTAMLKRYHALERTGLSERDCLLQLLATRNDWQKFSHRFLIAIVSRLQSKEDVMRFISLSEDYGYQRDPYPELASRSDVESSIAEIACLFSRFGFRLQSERRYKEAEFVQKLALRLEPDEYFTNLPLAATYYETGRYADALPLFKSGFTQLERFETDINSFRPVFSPTNCLAPDQEQQQLRQRYQTVYEACLKAIDGKSIAPVTLLTVMELIR